MNESPLSPDDGTDIERQLHEFYGQFSHLAQSREPSIAKLWAHVAPLLSHRPQLNHRFMRGSQMFESDTPSDYPPAAVVHDRRAFIPIAAILSVVLLCGSLSPLLISASVPLPRTRAFIVQRHNQLLNILLYHL
jgi:hypothetical protein